MQLPTHVQVEDKDWVKAQKRGEEYANLNAGSGECYEKATALMDAVSSQQRNRHDAATVLCQIQHLRQAKGSEVGGFSHSLRDSRRLSVPLLRAFLSI